MSGHTPFKDIKRKALSNAPTPTDDPDVVRTGDDVTIMAPTATIDASFGLPAAADKTKED